MENRDLTIRIAGEAGEGVQSTGQLVTQAASRAGFRVLTFYSPPAEIKGGHALFEIRLARDEVHSRADDVDILLAFNQEAYDRNIDDLRPNGLLIYDPAQVAPPPRHDLRQVSLPITDIAKTRLRFERGKNVVAFGAASALFGLPTSYLTKLVQDRFGRYVDVLQKNFDSVNAGASYVEENIPERDEFKIEAEPPDEHRMVVSGNQAVCMGALAAGLKFMAGYPITPASDIMEFLASELPKVGGTVVQAEDEISALGMVLGASYAGAKAMTSTSGPGVSLMVEMLGLASMAELPCVLVDAQRGGPSTGMPTRHEQGDLYLAVFAGHGEVPKIVLSPTSVSDCFYQTINAFNLAERYQLPVLLMQDTILAVRTESIPRPDLSTIEVWNRETIASNGAGVPGEATTNGAANGHTGPNGHAHGDEGYLRYKLTETGVSVTSIPGQPGGQYVATGLEHSESAAPAYDRKSHREMTEKRMRKLEHAVVDAPPPDLYGDQDADVGIVTWGSTAGSVKEAINVLKERGINACMVAPRMLWPLPDHQLKDFVQKKRHVFVAEVNYTGQLALLLRQRYLRDVQRINTYEGVPFKVAQIVKAVEGIAHHV